MRKTRATKLSTLRSALIAGEKSSFSEYDFEEMTPTLEQHPILQGIKINYDPSIPLDEDEWPNEDYSVGDKKIS